jgi:hypothetical protein
MEESGKPARGTLRLVAMSAAVVLLVAAAVWLELRLLGMGWQAEPAWLKTILRLSAIFFVPAIVAGAALAHFLRRRRR